MPSNSSQEFTLLCSTFPAFLLPALNFCFITDSLNIVSATSLQNADKKVQPTQKYYFKRDVEQILEQFEITRQYGRGSVDEWVKGLDAKRKADAQDFTRWENWEAKGGLKRVNARPNQKQKPKTKLSIAMATLPNKPERYDHHGDLNILSRATTATLGSPAQSSGEFCPVQRYPLF